MARKPQAAFTGTMAMALDESALYFPPHPLNTEEDITRVMLAMDEPHNEHIAITLRKAIREGRVLGSWRDSKEPLTWKRWDRFRERHNLKVDVRDRPEKFDIDAWIAEVTQACTVVGKPPLHFEKAAKKVERKPATKRKVQRKERPVKMKGRLGSNKRR